MIHPDAAIAPLTEGRDGFIYQNPFLSSPFL